MDTRALEFLHESNAIEGIHNIDYRRPENARAGLGHVGAFLDSQERAQRQALPTVEDVARWQGMLTEEQLAFGHDIPHIAPDFTLVASPMAELFGFLHARFGEDSLLVRRLALVRNVFQRFEAIHPFVEAAESWR